MSGELSGPGGGGRWQHLRYGTVGESKASGMSWFGTMEVVCRASLSALPQAEQQMCKMRRLAEENGRGNGLVYFGEGHLGCSVGDLVTANA